MDKRYTRTALAVVWAVLAGVVGTIAGGAPRSAAVDAPPAIVLAAKASSPVAVGAQAIADVTVRNDGDLDAAGPVVLTIAGLPAGITVLRIDEQVADRQWNCAAGTPVRCTYAATSNSTVPVGFLAGERTSGRVRLAVAAGTSLGATLNLTFTVTVGTTITQNLTSSAQVTFTKLAATQTGSVDGFGVLDAMVAGQAAHLRLDVTNLGPASISTVAAAGLLPPGATNPAATGTGWSCATKSGAWSCTWTGTTRGVGVALPTLAVTFTSPATATAPGSPLTWKRTLTATTSIGGATITRSDDQSGFVLTDRAPVVRTIAAATASGSVEPGQTVEIAVGVEGSGFDDAARTVTVRSTLPGGWAYVARSGDDPWTCTAVSSALACTRSAAFAGGASSSTTNVRLRAPSNVAVGGQQAFSFSGSVSGPGAAAASTAAVTIDVVAGGAAASTVRLWRYSPTGTATTVTDGSAITLTKGASSSFGLDVFDSGGAAIARSTVLSLVVTLPAGSGAVAQPDGGTTAWSCGAPAAAANGQSVTCTTTLTADVVPGTASPRLRLGVTVPLSTQPGPTLLGVVGSARSAGIDLAGLHAETVVNATVVAPAPIDAPQLSLVAEVVQAARDGGRPGTLRVTASNTGTKTMAPGWSFVVALPGPLSAAAVKLLAGRCDYVTKPSYSLNCAAKSTMQPGKASPPLDLPIQFPLGWTTANPARTSAVLTVNGTAAGSAAASVDATMQVLPPLFADAVASPTEVVSSPDPATIPDSPVQLDGRGSSATDAIVRWEQVITIGTPVVAFDGLAAGAPAGTLLTTFVPLTVTAVTTLTFRLTISDGWTTSSTTVNVNVSPATSAQGDTNEPGTSTTTSTTTDAPTFRSTATSTRPLIRTASFSPALTTGEWIWSTPPTISPNDVGAIRGFPAYDGPVYGSRMRVLDPGVLTWNGADPAPPMPTITYSWSYCQMVWVYDPDTDTYVEEQQCPVIGTGTVVVNTSTTHEEIDLIATATDANGVVAGTATFPVGFGVTYPYSQTVPTIIVAPTLEGIFAVGNTLTLDPGEWSLEFTKENVWQRCTPDLVTCSQIPETVHLPWEPPFDEYTVTAADVGLAIRVVVTAYSQEMGLGHTDHTTNALQGGVSITCDPNCFTWSAEPAINRDGNNDPQPVSTRPATLVDNGTFAWNDASAAPTSTTKTVAWFVCAASDASNCTQVGTGSTFTPLAADVGNSLEARLTVAGTGVDGNAHSTTHVVPFGTVRDVSAGPAVIVQPSISSAVPFYVDPANPFSVLTAQPGTWAYSTGTNYTYRWLRCQQAAPDTCAVISGQTGSTYLPQYADLTDTASVIRVDVTAPGFVNSSTVRSTPSTVMDGYLKRVVTAPSIDPGAGGPRVGVEMTATPAVWSELPTTLGAPAIEWQYCSSPTDDTTCFGFGVTTPTFTPGEGLQGYYLRIVSTVHSTGFNPDAFNFTYSPRVGPIGAASVAVTAATDLVGGSTTVGNGTHVTVTGSGTGVGTLSYRWAQTSGTPTVDIGTGTSAVLSFDAPATGAGVLGFRLTVTDAENKTATTDITVEYVVVQRPQDLCDLVDKFRRGPDTGGIYTAHYGPFDMNYAGAVISGPGCDQNTAMTISNSFVTVFGWMTIAQPSVVIDADGISITGGTIGMAAGTGLTSATFTMSGNGSLVIPFDPTDGTYEVKGILLASGMPALVHLPFDWKGAARLELASSSAGVQTLGLSAEAWKGAAGTPDGSNLPIPPAGVGLVTISGSISTDATYSLTVTATDVVKIKSTSVNFAGSISRAAAGAPVVVTASGSLSGAPLQLANNLYLNSASLAWDGSTFTGDGSLGVYVNGRPLALTASFSFTDPGTWSASLALASSSSWTPIPGLTINAPSATGTIGGVDGTRTMRLTISASSATIGGQNGVTLTQPSFSTVAICQATGSCSFDLTFSSGVAVVAFGQTITGQLNGQLATGDGSFSAQASLGGMTITSGIAFNSSTLKVTQNSSGLTVELATTAQILGGTFAARLSFGPDATVFVIEVGAWTPFNGAPQIQNAFFVYASAATTVDVGGRTISVPKNTLWLSATAPAPVWFKNLVGGTNVTATIDGRIGLSPLSLDITLTFQFDHIRLFNVGGVELYLDQVAFNFHADGSTFSTTLSGTGQLWVPSVGGGAPSRLPVDVRLFFNATTGVISGAITLGGPFGTTPAWNNAFGVSGLTIQYLSVTVGIGSGLPSIGFSGGVVLPDGWAAQIGIQPGTQLQLSAAIAGASSCFGVSINQPDPTRNAIDVAGVGALTAKSASFYIAPNGCTIGRTVLPPGIALSFDGAILGVAVKANIAVTPSPLAIQASFTLGDISLSGLSVKNTTVSIDISPTTKAISFAAKADAFGVRADVTGSFRNVGGATAVSFTGHFSTPYLGGFQLDHLDVTFEYTSSPANLTLTADADIVILGQTQHIDLAFSMVNGAITHAEGNADLSLTIGELALTGRGHFVLNEGSFPDITIAGSATIGGRAVSTVSARLTGTTLEFTGTLNIPGLFTYPPQLSGFVAWGSGGGTASIRRLDGSYGPASNGDFRFDATNLGLNTIAGFSLSANVTIARIGGVFSALLSTSATLGLDHYGTGSVGFTGSFDSTGNLSLSGYGQFWIGGFYNIGVTFALTKTGSTSSISGSAMMNVPGIGSVSVSGSFAYGGRFGATYSLTGTMRVRLPGYDLGQASVSVYRVLDPTWGAIQGMNATGSIDVGGVAKGTVYFEMFSSGRLTMHSWAATQGFLKDTLGAATVRLDLDHLPGATSDTLSFAFDYHASFLPATVTLSGSVNSLGGFTLNAGFYLGPYHDSYDIGVCTAYYDAYASMTLTIGYLGFGGLFSIALTGEAEASAGCGIFGAGIGLGVYFDYRGPSDVTLRVRLKLSFGSAGSWNPVIYSV